MWMVNPETETGWMAGMRQAPKGCLRQMGVAARAGESQGGASRPVRPEEAPGGLWRNPAFGGTTKTDSPCHRRRPKKNFRSN